ncbi:MAG: 4Fe-4S binding protein [Nanoarchaeota archaeon]|nr:4Fe-4S binding protein [Nanoarchaeota archaeon]MBU1135106.1 4Fe-4S binding protein [Nanoarchaeota archaeon]MBU2520110.1 4Fe-4S binding protein [Nanoarchaeota archaeon]
MIEVNKNKCLRCGGCISLCAVSALMLTEHGIKCDINKCVNCEACVRFCPVDALKIKDE